MKELLRDVVYLRSMGHRKCGTLGWTPMFSKPGLWKGEEFLNPGFMGLKMIDGTTY